MRITPPDDLRARGTERRARGTERRACPHSAAQEHGTGDAPGPVMLAPMTLGLRVADGEGRLDPRGLRALLVAVVARTGDGLVAVDDRDEVVFACPRASAMLGRLGGVRQDLPGPLEDALLAWRDAGASAISTRIATSGRALHLRITSASGIPGVAVLLWVREEQRRDDRLYTAFHERYALSRRTFQLALLVRQGLTNREIAGELRLSESTVKIYLHTLYRACGVRSRTGLVALMEWTEAKP